MNTHLEPVFNILLPGLEKSGIDYWVYGGVSIAAYKGEFIRFNEDVDVFVKNNDFEKAKSILDELCNQNNFKISIRPPAKGSHRPKLDIKIGKVKVLSVIPVYPKNGVIKFENYDGDKEYSNQILQKVERNISGYKFFTPQNVFIKELFNDHIIARPDKKKISKFQIDARAILNSEELTEFGIPTN